MRRTPLLCLIVAFVLNVLGPLPASAQDMPLPKPGLKVSLSPPFNPPILKGLKVDSSNPFRFEFILDQGDSSQDLQSRQEANKLIKYFLASITTPEKDLWVNLSPYEKDRIIPESFGQTEMGRDLLAQDYILKQITASLMSPDDEVGKKFWKKIYDEASNKYGTTNIPVSTFNKVWIVPEKAVVYENSKAGVAYVVESKLKVMLESDYLAGVKNKALSTGPVPAAPSQSSELGKLALPVERAPASGPPVPIFQKNDNEFSKKIIREIIIPELTTEINEGKNFAQLRQVYNSLILANWYKKKIKDSILSKVYADKNKIKGLSSSNVSITNPESIYKQYLQAFKKGAVNLIKEEQDPITQKVIPRKYFSGGFNLNASRAMVVSHDSAMIPNRANMKKIAMVLSLPKDDQAMRVPLDNKSQVSNLKEWQDIEPMPVSLMEEDIAVQLLQDITRRDWTSIDVMQLRLLKGFVNSATDSARHGDFEDYLTDDIISAALSDQKNGVFELVRRCHPYTVAVLRNPNLDVVHFRLHEGVYYWLFAQKHLLKRLGDEPIIIANLDPHTDLWGEDSEDRIIETEKEDVFIAQGVTDYNWVTAAVRDGFAQGLVLSNINGYGMNADLLERNEHGEVAYKHEHITNGDLKPLEKFLEKYPKYRILMSVDLDTFALRMTIGDTREPKFYSPAQVNESMRQFLHYFRGMEFLKTIITADSRNYLNRLATESWITEVRSIIGAAFRNKENALVLEQSKAMTSNSFNDILQRGIPNEDEFNLQIVKRGDFNLVFTPWRLKKRQPSRMFNAVDEAFDPDPDRFNFNKLNPDEVFFEGNLNGRTVTLVKQQWPYAKQQFLIVPERTLNYNQTLYQEDIDYIDSLVMQRGSKKFYIAFSGLQAGASVNHKHFHATSFDQELPLQLLPKNTLYNMEGVTISTVPDYPAHVVFFSSPIKKRLSHVLYQYTEYLRKNQIAYSLVVGLDGIYVFPVKHNVRSSITHNIWDHIELMGTIYYYEAEQADQLTEASIKGELRALTLPDDQFATSLRDVFGNSGDSFRQNKTTRYPSMFLNEAMVTMGVLNQFRQRAQFPLSQTLPENNSIRLITQGDLPDAMDTPEQIAQYEERSGLKGYLDVPIVLTKPPTSVLMDPRDPDFGWKFHLNVSPEDVQAVSQYLKREGYIHKFLHGGEIRHGKIFTVYIGSYAQAVKEARVLSRDLRSYLKKPRDTREIEFAPGISGRFKGKTIRKQGQAPVELSQYGSAGIQHLKSLELAGLELAEMEERSFNVLYDKYKTYFYDAKSDAAMTAQEEFLQRFKPVSLQSQPLLLRGIQVDPVIYKRIFTQGISPKTVYDPKNKIDKGGLFFTNNVSFTLSHDGNRQLRNFAIEAYGPKSKADHIIVILKPDKVREGIRRFELVGSLFKTQELLFLVSKSLKQLGFKRDQIKTKNDTYPDEVHFEDGGIVPSDYIGAIIVHPDKLDTIKRWNKKLGLSNLKVYVVNPFAQHYEVYEEINSDPAMSLNSTQTGGIDFTTDQTPLEINKDSANGINFNQATIDPAMLQQLQNSPGFIPIIIDIQPVTDLKEFLGILI